MAYLERIKRQILAEVEKSSAEAVARKHNHRPTAKTIREWVAEHEALIAENPNPRNGVEYEARRRAYQDSIRSTSDKPPLLCPEAERALSDFGLFQRRYFGRIAVPWQVAAANRVVELLESPEKEYVVINAPPGSGKSTTFTLDIAAWVTCRNRAIRGLMGSRTDRQARWYLGRLRREFERSVPAKAEEQQLRRGEALDAEATMAGDYGRFKPELRDVWSAEQFVVAQHGGVPIAEKESTWTSVGMDTNFLGGRFDLCLWDDLVTPKEMRNLDSREAVFRFFDEVAESRLEPAGLLVLQGQRVGADDLYRYALDKVSGADDPDDEDVAVAEPTRKYHHVVFKAHYDEVCEGRHKRADQPYGAGGCLLYPRRLPWTDLQAVARNDPNTYEVMYQQQDANPRGNLVEKLWIEGGRDPATGIEHPGCWDADRDIAQLYPNLAGEVYSYATVDPSPTRFWAIFHVVYHPASEQRFVVDLARQKMDAPDFLDWNYNEGRFTGLMEEWQERSREMGAPIQAWIVEANAAQKFLLQYDHVRRWQAANAVDIVPHTTHLNKADPTYGVESIAPHFRFGRVRLPGKGSARGVMMKFVDELVKWPHGTYDDTVMAYWFGEWSLPRLFTPGVEDGGSEKWTPSWL